MKLDVELFNNYWHLVCHRRELLRHGDFIKFDTPIGAVVVFNDQGNILAFDNRCAHRGALIYSDDFGNQAHSCKYHGWSFQNGKVIVPDPHRFKGCDIDKADLNRYQIDWCGDFAFLGITPRSALYEQLSSVAEILEDISFSIDARRDFNRYPFECYWPLAVENALEPYHLPLVHPQSLHILELGPEETHYAGINTYWNYSIGNTKIDKRLNSLGKYFNLEYQHKGYMSIFLFPFTMLSSTYGYSYSLQNFFPCADNQTTTNFTSRLLSANLASAHSAEILETFFDSSVAVNRQVFEEDNTVCRLLPKDSWNMEPLKYGSNVEMKIDFFRSLCKQTYAAIA